VWAGHPHPARIEAPIIKIAVPQRIVFNSAILILPWRPACSARASLYDWDPVRQCHLNGTTDVLESRPGYKYDRCGYCNSASVEQAEPLTEIFLWCHMPDNPQGDWPVHKLEWQWGLRRERDLFYTPEHGPKAALSPDDVPTLYQLWDCLLYLSGGEGFGLPAWEAMCCGLPAVYTNYSAHGELLTRAEAGLPVGGLLQPEVGSCLWRMIADAPQAVEAVLRLYHDNNLRQKLGANGRAFAHQFAPDIQVQRWHSIFQSIMSSTSAVS